MADIQKQDGEFAKVRDPLGLVWDFAWDEVRHLPWVFWGGMSEREMVDLHAEADKRLPKEKP